MAEQRQGTSAKLVVMGIITGAHGVRGEVKIKSFTDNPADIAAYGRLLLDDGPREVKILRLRPAKGLFIAKLDGIDDRNAAEALKGCKLKLPRERLPEPEEDEFYHEDLLGLRVEDEGGQALGRIKAVQNFGAGDLLEVQPERGASFYVPFTRRDVPEVDIAGGRVIVRLPEPEEDSGGAA